MSWFARVRVILWIVPLGKFANTIHQTTRTLTKEREMKVLSILMF
jgi:hypothetical protein